MKSISSGLGISFWVSFSIPSLSLYSSIIFILFISYFSTSFGQTVLLLDIGRGVSLSVANTLGQHTAGLCLLLPNDAGGLSFLLTVPCAMIPFPLVGAPNSEADPGD